MEEKKKVYFTLKKKPLREEREEIKSKKKNIIIKILIFVLVFVLGFGSAFLIKNVFIEEGDYTTLDEIKFYLKNYWLYSDEYEDIETYLTDEAYYGISSFSNDPYTTYMSKEELEEMSSSINMDYVGIGVSYSSISGLNIIQKVFIDSPAYKAGLEKGDIIVGVDGEDIDGLSTDEIKELVVGEEGTEVTINILRGNDELAITCVRDSVDSSAYAYQKDDYIYLEISSFGMNTASEIMKYLDEYSDIKNIIIDIRDDGGGYQDSVEEIAGLFIGDNEIYMIQKDNEGNSKTDYTDCEKTYSFNKIIILINDNTASAAEVFTICLKEHLDNVTTVGETTYGKGVMQTTVSLSNGGALKFTAYEWLSPNGNSINGVGITPDEEIKQNDLEYEYYYEMLEDEEFTVDSVSDQNRLAQKCLELLGYEVDRTDGYFSSETLDVLNEFRIDSDLKTKEILDKESYDLLLSSALKRLYTDESLDYQLNRAIELLAQ